MSKRNTTLPGELQTVTDKQVATMDSRLGGDQVREQIRKEQDRLHLRNTLLAGAESAATTPVETTYFDALRNRAHRSRQG